MLHGFCGCHSITSQSFPIMGVGQSWGRAQESKLILFSHSYPDTLIGLSSQIEECEIPLCMYAALLKLYVQKRGWSRDWQSEYKTVPTYISRQNMFQCNKELCC